MSLAYGYVKGKIVSNPVLKGSQHSREMQYHLHFSVRVDDATGTSPSMSAPTTPTIC